MSKYIVKKTEYKSRTMLRRALVAALGEGVFEEHAKSTSLYGYKGKRRDQRAEYIVRRKHIGSSSNDLGYRWNLEAGCFEAVVSEYDLRCSDTTRIRDRIRKEYAAEVVIAEAKAEGYTVVRAPQSRSGEIQLVISGEIPYTQPEASYSSPYY